MSTADEGLTTPGSFDTPEMRIDQKVTLYVEPTSGVTVYMEDNTKRSGTIPVPDELFPSTSPLAYMEFTLYEDNLTFTDDTVADLVSQAKSAKTQVALAKNLLPWLSIGAGILLIAVGIFLASRKTAQVERQEPQAAGGPQPG
jgi:hypothetical protein